MYEIETFGRIIETRRMKGSKNGNPKYRVWFVDSHNETHCATTATDADCAYGIGNAQLKIAAKITYHITRNANKIIDYCSEAKVEDLRKEIEKFKL